VEEVLLYFTALKRASASALLESLFRLKPNQYAHILNNNTQVTRVVIGPATITRLGHETIVFGPAEMINVPPRAYCKIKNPVIMKDGQPVVDPSGQIAVKYGWQEIRFEGPPFPLYPGEEIVVHPTPLKIINVGQAFKIKAVANFTDSDGVERVNGEEWLIKGPKTYIPRVEEEVIMTVDSILVKINEAIILEAINDFVDANGVQRITGDKWLYRVPGAYLPGIYEVCRGIVKGIVITATTAVHVKANQPVVSFGKQRKAGDHWLVTLADTDMFIPEIEEEVVEIVPITVLSQNQFCVVLNPFDPETGIQKFGARCLIKGEKNFFLNPGEVLENGIENIYILGEEEALLLRAITETTITGPDGKSVKKLPGERWLYHGPCEYIPTIDVEVIEIRRTIPIGENEGVYVRNIDDGSVRAVIGSSYMLKENEELWEKVLSPQIEAIITKNRHEERLPYQVVGFNIGDKSAVQVFDYKTLKSKIVFGPEMVLLQPYETFTVMNLSSGFPKKRSSNPIIGLFLGPDFIYDQITVETADHACLAVKLAYSWRFDFNRDDQEASKKMFYSSDFVGDACRILGAEIRSVVAHTDFDDFHKDYSAIIRRAIFGEKNEIKFESNNLIIYGVDVQGAEPLDQSTRDSLLKSVQLAIEITAKSQEANARHEAERLEQESKSMLEQETIKHDTEAESSKTALIENKAKNEVLQCTGKAIGEAKAKAASLKIEVQAEVEKAQLDAKLKKTEFLSAFNQEKQKAHLEEKEKEEKSRLEIEKAKKEADIAIAKFKQMVDAITPEAIADIAKAGPEMQAQLLSGLGMDSMLITDGSTPINLFNAAQGLITSQ